MSRPLCERRRHTCICETIDNHIVNIKIRMQRVATMSRHAENSDARTLGAIDEQGESF